MGVDDILESMSRRTKFGSKLERDADFALNHGEEQSKMPTLKVEQPFEPRRREWGKFVFPLMLIGGIAIVLLAGAGRLALNASTINTLAQNGALTSVFSDPVKLAVLTALCFIPALWIKRRRRTSDPLLYA